MGTRAKVVGAITVFLLIFVLTIIIVANLSNRKNGDIVSANTVLTNTTGYGKMLNDKKTTDNAYARSDNANTADSNAAYMDQAPKNTAITGQTTKLFEDFYPMYPTYGYEGVPMFSEQAKSNDFLQRLKDFSQELNNTLDIYEFGFQPLYYMGPFDKGDGFINSPVEYGTKNQKIQYGKNGEEIYVTDIKTLQLGKKCYTVLNDLIASGKNFDLSDFSLNNSDDTVKVVLGSAYSKYYKISDVIVMLYYTKAINCEVVGFCKESAAIACKVRPDIDLDYSIIMPTYDLHYEPNDKNEILYQKIYYSQKIAGNIRIHEGDSYEALKINVDKLAKKYNLFYTIGKPQFSICFGQ